MIDMVAIAISLFNIKISDYKHGVNHFNIITWQNITKSMIKFHSAAVHVTRCFLVTLVGSFQ